MTSIVLRSGMDMAESHVVSALANKRAEIAGGMIARAQQQLGQFRADLVHLDATIRLFSPAMEPETIPPKRIRQSDLWFEPGGLSRRVLDALRRAGAPIRAPDLVRAVMIDTGLDPADRASFVRVQWKVRDTLNRLNKRGLLASDGAGHGVPSGGSPIRRFDDLLPRRCRRHYPAAHAGDGGWPSARRPHAWNWVPVASRRMSSRHAISPAYCPR